MLLVLSTNYSHDGQLKKVNISQLLFYAYFYVCCIYVTVYTSVLGAVCFFFFMLGMAAFIIF